MKLFVTQPDRQKYVAEITLSEPTAIKWFFDGFGGIHIDNRKTPSWDYYCCIFSLVMTITTRSTFHSLFRVVKE